MADETIYNPGSMSYEDAFLKQALDYFPELKTSGHYDFNSFIAQHPELQGMTEDYNVLGGMDVAKRIEPGSTWWSGNKALSTMGGLYSLVDTLKSSHQDWKEGFGDWYRNTKGIAIQRDWDPWFMNIDPMEKDYYQGLFKKMNLDKRKLDQMNEWQKYKRGNLRGELPEGSNVPGTPIIPMDRGRADRQNIQKIQQHTGKPLSDYRMSRPSSERQYTGHGKSGMGRDRSKLMATGGVVDAPLSGRSRYI